MWVSFWKATLVSLETFAPSPRDSLYECLQKHTNEIKIYTESEYKHRISLKYFWNLC